MKEPDGAGSGCMTYPFGDDCNTEPAVDISNITLKNISIDGGVTPGIIRCNETNPCEGFLMDNVQYTSWSSKIEGWTCENIVGEEKDVKPKGCIN